MQIIESGMLGHIIDLTQLSDVETSRFALGAPANIADDIRFHDVVAAKAGVVHTLTTLTTSPTLSIAREASRALSNLFSSMVAQNDFLNDEKLDSLVNISNLQDYECAYHAAVAFRKLSANSFSHAYFFAQDCVGAVLDLSRREERNIQLQCAAALRDLSSNQTFEVGFAEMGGIRTAIELSSLPDIDIQTIAFGMVRHLSIPMQLKRKLMDSGIVSAMANCVTRADSEDLLYQCASSIANMAEYAHNKVAFVQIGVMSCLISLSSKGYKAVQRETAQAFSLLSCAPENCVGVFDERVLPHLVDLLRCQDEETSRDSAATISNVANNPRNPKVDWRFGWNPSHCRASLVTIRKLPT